jgi:hypothetical protein
MRLKAHEGGQNREKMASFLSFVRLCVPSWFILPLASFPLSADLG